MNMPLELGLTILMRIEDRHELRDTQFGHDWTVRIAEGADPERAASDLKGCGFDRNECAAVAAAQPRCGIL